MALNHPFFNKINIISLLLAATIVVFVLCERAGWPFLAESVQTQLSTMLKREVSFGNAVTLIKSEISTDKADKALSKKDKSPIQPTNSTETTSKPFQITFLGGLNLKTKHLNIAAPAWNDKPHFIQAENVHLKLRYIDLWRAYRGKPIHIKSLQADKLDGYFERRPDGHATWQFSDKPRDPNKVLQLPTFDYLVLKNGVLHIDDVPLKTQIEAKVTLNNVLITDKTGKNLAKSNDKVLSASATGRYRAQPFKLQLSTSSALPTSTDKSEKLPVALKLSADIGRSHLVFKGTTANIMHLKDFAGDFSLKGPSLAAFGDFLKVTLPTTSAFNTNGVIDKKGLVWRVKLNKMSIGESLLNGDFTYDKGLKTPLLKGKLGGKRLVITDLGPAFGADTVAKNAQKVLPRKPFDLASLRRMNADVRIDIQYLDLKTRILEPLKPLQGHLQLKNAVLAINDIKASTADGRLTGDISLDGRGSKALWDANLGWNGVRLERWIKQNRKAGLPPYISGKLNGRAILKGHGKSTAEVLASLNGNVRSELHQGAVSHLGLEVAGIDLAQSVGALLKGDDALPVQCAVVDLQVKQGVFTPRAMVLDTTDTTIWVDGSLSLATETLNLRAMALPKDFSPLALRTPVNVTGTFSNPKVSLEKTPVALRLGASVLLAIINPIAAVIPLLDTGDNKEAKQRAAGCASMMKKNSKK